MYAGISIRRAFIAFHIILVMSRRKENTQLRRMNDFYAFYPLSSSFFRCSSLRVLWLGWLALLFLPLVFHYCPRSFFFVFTLVLFLFPLPSLSACCHILSCNIESIPLFTTRNEYADYFMPLIFGFFFIAVSWKVFYYDSTHNQMKYYTYTFSARVIPDEKISNDG